MMEKYNINKPRSRYSDLCFGLYKILASERGSQRYQTDVKTIQLQMKRLERKNILSGIIKGRNKEYP